MAKSKALTKTCEHVDDAPLTSKVTSGSPYQLDPAQVEKAAKALVAHMKKHAQQKEQATDKKNLAADEDEPTLNDDPIYLNLSTKKHIQEQNRLKPNKIVIPHSIQSNDVRICLITVDPQRQYKNIVADAAFPQTLRARIARVIGIEKLKKKYNTFETKRQLVAEYDLFLADDRVVSMLPGLLGKPFYSGKGKRPIPVRLTAGVSKDALKNKNNAKKEERTGLAGTPQAIAKEIESAMHSTPISLSTSANTTIKVGKLSMTPQQIKENVEKVVSDLVARFVPQGWRNIRSLHIKGPTTMSLPIWLADELWAEEKQVLDQPWQPTIQGEGRSAKTKRKWEEWEEEMLDEDEVTAIKEARTSAKKPKAEPLSHEDKESISISKEAKRKLKKEALSQVKTPLIAG